tara:strand:+ start:107 stop:319 length:213 start_codon:yes stop_codon:yes gene_type:complete
LKIGDLVRLKKGATRVGVIVDVIQKKCWRTNKMGKKINWDVIDPEPHGVVLFNDCSLDIPVIELEAVVEE